MAVVAAMAVVAVVAATEELRIASFVFAKRQGLRGSIAVMELFAGLDLITIAATAALLTLAAAHYWYDRWCDRNGVPRPSGSTSADGIACGDGDGGD